eukprot:gene9559-12144_t
MQSTKCPQDMMRYAEFPTPLAVRAIAHVCPSAGFQNRREEAVHIPRVFTSSSDVASNNAFSFFNQFAPGFQNPTIPRPQGGGELGWSTAFHDHYSVVRLLGRGSFGVVHEGIDLESGYEVAIKIMPKSRKTLSRDQALQRLTREVDILDKLQRCRNVVRLLGRFEDAEHVQMVMELCRGGDLQKYVEKHGALNEKNLALVAVEILKIIGACHALNILHGDVKPANFCLKHPHANPLFSQSLQLAASPWLKALDFGCSQNITNSQRLVRRSGTPMFMAPEIYARDYGVAADMWSFGMTLYWLYAHAASVRAAKLDDVMLAVENDPIPMDYGNWRTMSSEGVDFIRRCLTREERSRLTLTEALNHPWLQDAVLATGSFDLM